jgi:hypothetical protein
VVGHAIVECSVRRRVLLEHYAERSSGGEYGGDEECDEAAYCPLCQVIGHTIENCSVRQEKHRRVMLEH